MQTLESDLETALGETESLKADYKTKVTSFQHDNTNLQSTLDARERELAEAKQTISNLLLASETAQEEAERLRGENANLWSTLGARTEVINEANQTISKLETDLETTRKEAERLRTNYVRLQSLVFSATTLICRLPSIFRKSRLSKNFIQFPGPNRLRKPPGMT